MTARDLNQTGGEARMDLAALRAGHSLPARRKFGTQLRRNSGHTHTCGFAPLPVRPRHASRPQHPAASTKTALDFHANDHDWVGARRAALANAGATTCPNAFLYPAANTFVAQRGRVRYLVPIRPEPTMPRECTRCLRPFELTDLSREETENLEARRKETGLEGVKFLYFHCPACAMDDIFVAILPLETEFAEDYEAQS